MEYPPYIFIQMFQQVSQVATQTRSLFTPTIVPMKFHLPT